MERIAAPTRRGIAITPAELMDEIPPSHLNPEIKRNWNNHHSEYIKRLFGKCCLLNTVRNFESQQTMMLLDQHQWWHDNFEMPPLPTPDEAFDFYCQQAAIGALLKVKKGGKGYVTEPVSDYLNGQVERSYADIKKHGGYRFEIKRPKRKARTGTIEKVSQQDIESVAMMGLMIVEWAIAGNPIIISNKYEAYND